MHEAFQEKCAQVNRVAQELYSNEPDWVTFFREVLGLEGIVRKAFPDPESLANFERSKEYSTLQHMLTRLRDRNRNQPNPQEPTTVITVRLPKSLHDALRVEAHERRTSINQLCIAKLLRALDGEYAGPEEETIEVPIPQQLAS